MPWPIKNITLLRCFCNSSRHLKGILILSPVIAFSFIVAVRLKHSGKPSESEQYIEKSSVTEQSLNPHSESHQNYHSEQPQNHYSVSSKRHIRIPKFPLVDEFQLSQGIRKFDNEGARPVGFPVKQMTNLNSTTKFIHLATPYFTKWNPRHYYFLHFGNVTFTRYSCPVNNCYVTKNPSQVYAADVVLFHVRDLEVFSIPSYRSPEQIWILYSMEPPWLEVKDMRRFEGVFNWTMSYRRNSDVNLQYGFIGKRRTPNANVPSKIPKRKRDGAIWLVSNCNTDSNREQYVDRLRKIYPVDVKGGCGADSCKPAESKRCYVQLAARYKFYLSFENAICEDYVTEKLFNALEYFVIPITLGGANYSDFLPPNSIINAMDFQSPEDLGRYLWKVSNNESLYLSYFEWKRTYRSYLQPWMCDLCEKLHHLPVSAASKTIHHLERWWNGEGPCMRWSGEGFQAVDKHPFPKYRLKIFE